MGCAESAASAGRLAEAHSRDAHNLSEELVDSDEMLKLVVKDSWLTAKSDTIQITKEDGSNFLEVKGTTLALCNRLVFHDQAGEPVAVCMIRPVHLGLGLSGPGFYLLGHGFYVYSFKPRVKGQAASAKEHVGRPLYSWAHVTAGVFSAQTYTMRMATDNDTFEGDTYTVETVGGLAHDLTMKKNGKGCCLFERGWSHRGEFDSHRLTVAPGVDPVLMACFIVMKEVLCSCDEGL